MSTSYKKRQKLKKKCKTFYANSDDGWTAGFRGEVAAIIRANNGQPVRLSDILDAMNKDVT